MVELRFNFIDIFRAPRLALSAKKIWTQLRALALGLILYDVFAYAAFAVSGADVYRIWTSYYLFPSWSLAGSVYPLNAGGVVLWAVGAVAFFFVTYLGMTAVAKITIEQLRGNDFYSRREAGQYVKRHWRPVLFAPVAVLVSLAALFGGGLLVGLVGKIPWFGDVVASLSLIPLYLGALLFVFLVIVFFLSFCLTPAVVATTGDDTFETSFELFSTLSGQPWRLVVYELLLWTLATAGAAVFSFFSAAALKVAYLALYVPMGPKFEAAFAAAWRVMPCWLRGAYPGEFAPLAWFSDLDVRAFFATYEPALPLPWPQAIAATFLSLGLLAIFGVIASYVLNVNTVGQTIIYTVLRKKKDDENLLEMYDDELEQAMLALGAEAEPGPAAETEGREEDG